jgi:hypothetical protein
MRWVIGITASTLACFGSTACTALPWSSTRIEATPSPHVVSGIVVDSAGKPIGAVTILQSFCPNGHLPCNDSLEPAACSDASGRFAFELPANGLYSIAAMVNGFIIGVTDVTIPRNDRSMLPITVGHVAAALAHRPTGRPCVPVS